MTVKFADLKCVLIAAWRGLHPGCDKYLHPGLLEMAGQIETLLKANSFEHPTGAERSIRDTCEAWLALFRADRRTAKNLDF